MKCESCNEREATIVFTTVSGDQKQTLHLCPECSKQESERQVSQPDKPQSVKPKHVTSVKKVNVVVGHLAGTQSKAKSATCPDCGMTYEEFRKIGRLGCARCYEAFGAPLRRLLKRIHGADVHVGRGSRPQPQAAVNASAGTEEDVPGSLASLRQELEKAVEDEAYERAAELRDLIARRGAGA